MTIKPLYAFLILGAFIALGIYAYQVTVSGNANEVVIEKLESDAIQKDEDLKAERKAKKELQEKIKELAETDFEEGEDLEEQKQDLKNEEYENEPYTITDADSLAGVIAKRIERLKAN